MRPGILILVTFLLSCHSAFSQQRHVTLSIFTRTNESPKSVTLDIAEGETASITCIVPYYPITGGYADESAHLYLEKDGVVVDPGVSLAHPNGVRPNPLVIAGPARFILSGKSAMITFSISKESHPADKTAVIPAGAGITSVRLESSGDLLNWKPATNGIYGRADSHTFFRINLESLNP